MELRCGCGQAIRIPDALAGKIVTCRGCGEPIDTAAPLAPSAAVPAATSTACVPWEDESIPFSARLWNTWAGSIFSPSEFFGRLPYEGRHGSALTYPIAIGILLTFVIFLFVIAWFALFGASANLPLNAGSIAGAIVGGVLGMAIGALFVIVILYVYAAILHVCVKLLGGSGTFTATLRGLAYAMGPSVFQLIPFVGGLMTLVWGIVCQVAAVGHGHSLGRGRAALAVLLAQMPGLLLGAWLIIRWLDESPAGPATPRPHASATREATLVEPPKREPREIVTGYVAMRGRPGAPTAAEFIAAVRAFCDELIRRDDAGAFVSLLQNALRQGGYPEVAEAQRIVLDKLAECARARPPQPPDREIFDRDSFPALTRDDIRALARAGYKPRPDSPLMQQFVAAWEESSEGWHERWLYTIFDPLLYRKDATLGPRLKRHALRPGVGKYIADRVLSEASSDDVWAALAAAAREGLVRPSELRGLYSRSDLVTGFLEAWIRKKPTWEEADDLRLAEMTGFAKNVAVPAGALPSLAGRRHPLRFAVALRAVESDRDAARRMLRDSFPGLRIRGSTHWLKAHTPAEAAELFLVIAENEPRASDSSVGQMTTDLVGKLTTHDALERVVDGGGLDRDLDPHVRGRLVVLVAADPALAAKAVPHLAAAVAAGAFMRDVPRSLLPDPSAPDAAGIANALASGCASSPARSRPLHPALRPYAAMLKDDVALALLKALAGTDTATLAPLVADVLAASPAKAVAWESHVLAVPEAWRGPVEAVLLSQPGQVKKHLDRLKKAFASGRTGYPATALIEAKLPEAERRDLVLACLDALEAFPDAYLPWFPEGKPAEQPRTAFVTAEPRVKEALPRAVAIVKRAEGAKSPALKAARHVAKGLLDDRAIKYVIDRFDAASPAWLEPRFASVVDSLPAGDRRRKEYWSKLYEANKGKLPKQVE